jgi:hypothetical protein
VVYCQQWSNYRTLLCLFLNFTEFYFHKSHVMSRDFLFSIPNHLRATLKVKNKYSLVCTATIAKVSNKRNLQGSTKSRPNKSCYPCNPSPIRKSDSIACIFPRLQQQSAVYTCTQNRGQSYYPHVSP